MSLDQETVKRIATLARMTLPPERIGSMQQDLNNILHFIDQLNEVNTSHADVMVGVNKAALPFRTDEVTDGNCAEKILANAPEEMCNMFAVPKVVE